MITIATIAAHIAYLRQFDPEYAEWARANYWQMLGPYLQSEGR